MNKFGRPAVAPKMFRWESTRDASRVLMFTNDEIEGLLCRGVLLAAGLWGVERHWYNRRDTPAPGNPIQVRARDVVGVLRAWQTYRDAVQAAPESRAWVTPRDRALVRRSDEITAFLARCGGFEMT